MNLNPFCCILFRIRKLIVDIPMPTIPGHRPPFVPVKQVAIYGCVHISFRDNVVRGYPPHVTAIVLFDLLKNKFIRTVESLSTIVPIGSAFSISSFVLYITNPLFLYIENILQFPDALFETV